MIMHMVFCRTNSIFIQATASDRRYGNYILGRYIQVRFKCVGLDNNNSEDKFLQAADSTDGQLALKPVNYLLCNHHLSKLAFLIQTWPAHNLHSIEYSFNIYGFSPSASYMTSIYASLGIRYSASADFTQFHGKEL